MSLRDTSKSIAAAARVLKVSPKTCMAAVEAGQIPSFPFGKRRRIADEVVKKLAAGIAVQAPLSGTQ